MNRQAEEQTLKALEVVERSDQLDEKIVAVTERSHVTMYVALAFIVMLILTQSVVLLSLASSNRHVLVSNKDVLESQIPGLKKQIESRDLTISDQNDELSQAADAITKLAKQVVALGGDPGIITIKPPKHPKPPPPR